MLAQAKMWEKLGQEPVDMLVVGGGINGAGIARDAANRGLKVALVEMRDAGQALVLPKWFMVAFAI